MRYAHFCYISVETAGTKAQGTIEEKCARARHMAILSYCPRQKGATFWELLLNMKHFFPLEEKNVYFLFACFVCGTIQANF